MPRGYSAAMDTSLAATPLTICFLLEIERVDDDTWFRMSSHQHDVIFGGNTYKRGVFEPRSADVKSDMSSNSLEPESVFVPGDSGIISREDVQNGRFRRARYKYYMVDYTQPDTSSHLISAGYVGRIEQSRIGYKIELRDHSALLQKRAGRFATENCMVDLFSGACGAIENPSTWAALTPVAVRDPHNAQIGNTVSPSTPNGFIFECSVAGTTDASEPTWVATLDATTTETGGVEWIARRANSYTGTITTVTDRRTIKASALPGEDAWWSLGEIVFTSGNNIGYTIEVESFSSADGTIVLKIGAEKDFQVGDTFTIKAGCNRHSHCFAKFRNNNRQVAPMKLHPGKDAVSQSPDSRGGGISGGLNPLLQLGLILIGGAAGAWAGIGFAAGALLTTTALTILFPTNQRGPRRSDLSIQNVEPGGPISFVIGRHRIAGHMAWVLENKITEKKKKKSVGPFGIGGTITIYIYSLTCLIVVADQQLIGYGRIWANNKIIADNRASNTEAVNSRSATITFLDGNENQLPPQIIVDDVGEDVAIAYLGFSSFLIESLRLDDFGGSVPQFEFECYGAGSVSRATINLTDYSENTPSNMFIDDAGLMYHQVAGTAYINVAHPKDGAFTSTGVDINYDAVGGGGPGGCAAFAVSGDGSTAWRMSNNSNAADLYEIDMEGKVAVHKSSQPGTLFPTKYSFLAGASRINLHENPINGTRRMAIYSTAGHIGFWNPDSRLLYGSFRAGDGDLGGLLAGTATFDHEGYIYMVASDATNVIIYKSLFDEKRGTGQATATPTNTAAPVYQTSWNVSSDIIDFTGASSGDIRVSFVHEIGCLLFYLAGYAYLFSPESGTMVGAGISVSDNGAMVKDALQIGVRSDGKICFFRDNTHFNILKVFDSLGLDPLTGLPTGVINWTLDPTVYDTADWTSVGLPGTGSIWYPDQRAVAMDNSGGDLKFMYLDRYSPAAVPLDDAIVSLVLRINGLDAEDLIQTSEINVSDSAIQADSVTGYATKDVGPLAGHLSQLLFNHRTDVLGVDGELRFVKRGSATSFTLDEVIDMGVGAVDPAPLSVMETYGDEDSLPNRFIVSYVSEDEAEAYALRTQDDKRHESVVATRGEEQYETVELLTDDYAKSFAYSALSEAYIALQEYGFSVFADHSDIIAGDRGTVTISGKTNTVRVTESEIMVNLINQIKARRDDNSIYTVSLDGAGSIITEITLPYEGPSEVFAFDLPIFNDADRKLNPVITVFTSPSRDTQRVYRGALIWMSKDGGASYEVAADLTQACRFGYTNNALAEPADPWSWDRDNSLLVDWVRGTQPTTITEAQALSGSNLMVTGNGEILIGATVNASGNLLTITDLIRARYGTEDKCSTHTTGEPVVMLDASVFDTIDVLLEDIGTEFHFSAQTAVVDADPTGDESLTLTGRSVMHYAPTYVRSGLSVADIVITWIPRSRFLDLWTLGGVLNMVEDESYEIDVYVDGVLKRTEVVAAGTYPDYEVSFTYTQAMQGTDGVSALSPTIVFKIYPINEDIVPLVSTTADARGVPFTLTYTLNLFEFSLTTLNPGFELGASTNWTTESGSWSVVTTDPRTGTYHGRGTGGSGVTDVWINDMVDLASQGVDTGEIDAGTIVLNATAYWKNENAGSNTLDRCRTGVIFYDSGMTETSRSISDETFIGGTYTELPHSAPAPSGTRYAAVVVYRREGHVGGTGLSAKMKLDDTALSYTTIG